MANPGLVTQPAPFHPGAALPASPTAFPAQSYAPPPDQPKLFLPVELKDYIRFFQVPARKWWWALAALAAYAAAYFMLDLFVAPLLFGTFAQDTWIGNTGTTPMYFLLNNIYISLDIAVCTALAWLFFRQGFGWLVSVVGRFR